MVRVYTEQKTEGGEGEVTEAEPQQAPTSRTTDGGSVEVAGQGTPLQEEREEGEMSTEEETTSTSQQLEGHVDNEEVEKAPGPTVANWAGEVEVREDGKEQWGMENGSGTLERVKKRKRRASRPSRWSAPVRGPEPASLSPDAVTSEEDVAAANVGQGRGTPPKLGDEGQLLDLGGKNRYQVLKEVSGSN
ncbi:unnamed protein product [Lampetra planeri]